MALTSMFALIKRMPKSQSQSYSTASIVTQMLSFNLHPTSIMLFGALFQSLLVLAVPRIYAFLPLLLIGLHRFSDTLMTALKLKTNPYLKSSILGRTTAIIPDLNGNFPSASSPSENKVAVLMLAIKFNHPLGMFAPHGQKTGEYAWAMFQQLDKDKAHNGFLGQSAWRSEDPITGGNELMLLSYWRSIEDIVAYSQGPLHKETWDWWNRIAKAEADAEGNGLKHIGISHEIFEAPRGKYESVYLNYQPSRMGATSFPKQKGSRQEEGQELDAETKWISPIVDARRGHLASSKGRLGQGEDHVQDEHQKY